MQFIFNHMKIKYEDMDAILKDEVDIIASNGDTINIFIDSDYIFNFLKIDYFKNVIDRLVSEDLFNEFCCEYFNFLGHYRNYFHKKGIYTRFFLINSTSSTIKNQLNPNFNSILDNRYTKRNNRIKNFILEKLEVFNPILVKHSYIINSGIVDSLSLPLIISNSDPSIRKSPSIFFTNNDSFLQYNNIFKTFFLIKTHKNFYLNDYSIFNYIQKSSTSKLQVSNEYIVTYLALVDNTFYKDISCTNKRIPRKIIKFLSEFNEDEEISMEYATKLHTSLFNNSISKSLRQDLSIEELFDRLKMFSVETTLSEEVTLPSIISIIKTKLNYQTTYNDAFNFNLKLNDKVNLKFLW